MSTGEALVSRHGGRLFYILGKENAVELSRRQLVKAVNTIRDQLVLLKKSREREIQQRLAKLAGQIEELQSIQRKLSVCETRAWQGAPSKVMKEIERPFYEINYLVREVEQAIAKTKMSVPSLREIYEELVQADEEFDEFRYDHKEQMLSVSTEPVELEGIYLGPFEIQLHIPALSEMQYPSVYRIVASDPHPAASNEAVTHPHVSDEGLCAGDAGASIQMALAGGRICDFFMLARSVLTNYNPDSPYVSLDDWYGTPCYDCGYTMASDDVRWCEGCECDFCSECISCCSRCDTSFCRGCLTECEVCEDYYCHSCMTDCPDCGRQLCETCLEENQCPCLEEENDENEEHETEGTETREDGKPATQVA